MKKILFIIPIVELLLVSQSFGQCDTMLSKTGNAHWRAAEVLMGVSSTAADYEQVIIEYKQVVKTDPNYAPTYMRLGKLYAQLCEDKGADAYENAKYYFELCKTICEDSVDAVDVELAILNALQRRRVDRFVGVWGCYMRVPPYSFIPYVEISHNGREYIFRPLWSYNRSRIDKVEKTETGIIFTYIWSENKDKTYSDEYDYHADEGYPTSGIYRYNKMVSTGRMYIAIDGDNVVEKGLSRHNDMYLGNRKVYAYTINYHGDPELLVKQGTKRPIEEE